jgi:hypothetical protein
MHTNQDGASRRGFPSMSMSFFSRWCCLQKCTGPKRTMTLSKFVPGCTVAFLEQTPLIVERHRVVSSDVKRWHPSPPRVEQILSRVVFKHLCTMSMVTSEVPLFSTERILRSESPGCQTVPYSHPLASPSVAAKSAVEQTTFPRHVP